MTYLCQMSEPPRLAPETIRNQFNKTEITRNKVALNHTHGVAAADRSTGSAFISRLASLLGMEAYFVQRSRADERKGRNGSRAHYWVKDLTAEPTCFDPPDESLLAFVDVDQYVDMPALLADQFKPTLIYTFQPSQVARVTENYSFTFNKDSEVEYTVTGGGKYVHHVWNYSLDNLIVSKKLFGIPYKTATYLVDRRETSLDHELILLTPLKRWHLFRALLVPFFLAGRALTRLSVVEGRFLRLMSVGASVKISTGKIGEFAQGTITAEADNTLSTLARTSKYDLTMPQVLSYTDGDRVSAAVLLDYHRSCVNSKPDVICPVPESINTYQFEPKTYDPSLKPLMVPFMNPILGDCYVPSSGYASEQVAVDERVNKVKSPILPITPQLDKFMTEFVTLLIPEEKKHTLHPYDDDYLYDKQNSPVQRKILEETQYCEPNRVIQSFLKKETYGDVKAPRVISTLNGTDKAKYSKYLYALSEEVLKPQAWYAFGKTPLEIATRVAEVSVRAVKNGCNSDFRKYDGHNSNISRELEQRTTTRAFHPQYHDDLLDVQHAQYNLKAFTPEGVAYHTEQTRASGSAETSTFNGLSNSFVAYIQYRLDTTSGPPLEPEAAFAAIGIVGGDDGYNVDVDPATYIRAAKMIGQELDCEPIERGQPGVKFLARVYSPDVWYGDINSCCDLPRQLTKIHVTKSLARNVTPIMKLLEKARAFILTDENTPIIGDFVRKAVWLHGGPIERDDRTLGVGSWVSKFTKDTQYVNVRADWMIEYAQLALPGFDLQRWNAWLDSVNSLEGLLHPPMMQEPKSAKPLGTVVVGEEILPRGAPINSATPIVPQSNFSTRPKRSKAEGVKMTNEEFEAWKAQRVAAGKWKEKPKTPPTVDTTKTTTTKQSDDAGDAGKCKV